MDDPATYWGPLIKLVPQLRCWVRAAWREGDATEVGRWGQMLIMPTAGYLEASDGPIPLRHVEWVEVSTMRIKGGIAGRPLQMVDAKDEIVACLRGTQLSWDLRVGVWSVEGLFEDEPVQVIRILNPLWASHAH